MQGLEVAEIRFVLRIQMQGLEGGPPSRMTTSRIGVSGAHARMFWLMAVACCCCCCYRSSTCCCCSCCCWLLLLADGCWLLWLLLLLVDTAAAAAAVAGCWLLAAGCWLLATCKMAMPSIWSWCLSRRLLEPNMLRNYLTPCFRCFVETSC